MSAIYDRLGVGYVRHRRPDPRVARLIHGALGGTRTVVNVGAGAGAGAYEPADRRVVAVEPSEVMIGQREPHGSRTVRATGEHLPFPNRSFDAALASLTIHHWADWRAGIAEMRRVARGPVVVFHFDLAAQEHLWLVEEYLPASLDIPAPSLGAVTDALGDARVQVVPVPRDCTDGFLCAYWARPEAYLDPAVRASISTFHLLPEPVWRPAVDALRADLESGAWDERHGHLRELDQLDVGYRLVVATP